MILYRLANPRIAWTCLAILMAVSTASEPPETKKTRLRSPGVISASFSASLTAGVVV
jgi:hypothetical protein